jgi:hypothetical protein
MRAHVVTVVCLLVGFSILAGETRAVSTTFAERPTVSDSTITFPEIMKKLGGAPTVSPSVVLEGAESAFLFPVVGSAGAFRTEAVMVNRLNRSQRVLLFFFPLGAGNCNIPAREFTMAAQANYLFTDFVLELFGIAGFGSVVALAVDSAGNRDLSALIDGNARIWSLAVGNSGTVSQNFPYATVSRTFDIYFNGPRSPLMVVTREIPACSLIQQAVSGGPYGTLEILFVPRDGGGEYYAYGATVDNASSDSWSVPARQ